MRIAQVLLSPRIGGAESLAASLEASWISKGHTAKTFYLDRTSGRSKFRLLRLARVLRTFKPEAIVSHSAMPNVYTRLAAPLGVGIFTVLHSASDDFEIRKLRWAERILRARTTAVIAVSESQLETYVSRFGRRVQTSVIPNGIRENLPYRPNKSMAPTSVSTIARIAQQKNPQFWLDVGDALSQRSPQLRLTWHGPATDEPGIAEIVRSATGPNVLFLPPTDDPGRELSRSDIVFHPASREAFSIGLLEAGAVGVPIVCSSVIAETLPGWLPKTTYVDGDVDSAANAIVNVVHNYRKAAEESAKAASRVRKLFSGEICADRYLTLIQES